MRTLDNIFLIAFLAILPLGATAQWSNDSNMNTQVSIHPKGELIPSVIPTGDGGMIVTWGRFQSLQWNKIIAQKFDADGNKLWQADGVAASQTDRLRARDYSITSDGDGGVIIAWCEALDGIVSFQRISASGAIQWGDEGVSLATNTKKYEPHLVPDNDGGAILIYREETVANQSDIIAQRISADGSLLWGDGIPICNRPGNQNKLVVVSDHVGGAVLSWQDLGTAIEFYAQRIDNSGTLLWEPEGILVCNNLAAEDTQVKILYHNGTYLLWPNTDVVSNVYLQKLSDDGQIAFEENGKILNLGSNVSTIGKLSAGDGENIFLTWDYFTEPSVGSSYIQKFNGAGDPLWSAGGVEYNVTSDYAYNPSVVSDGTGGVVIGYTRKVGEGLFDIYAQKLDGNAQPVWQAPGIPVGTNPNGIGRGGEILITSDTSGGAILIWVEAREPLYDVFAQRICSQGILGNCNLAVQNFDAATSLLYPNPASAKMNIEVSDELKVKSITVYNVLGQLVLNFPKAEGVSSIDVSNLESGTYLIKIVTDAGIINDRFIKI